ncbi:NAD(P)-binding protein [Tropicimonas marinistellae]|uniref:oxidoreductase n=1 Tax=Tropicimonas marinistellae TaxID=1739787 RepID=UPI000832C9DA|nr:NAD(P)-binding protein [Tropicimonas marinistellae]
MPRDPRYDILFEPVKIGPRTARNRFYQVPHCNGLGYLHASAMAEMRGIKAEGGWAVVNTEQCEIHPTADSSPLVEMRLWDDRDMPALELMAQKVQANGALAGVELTYNSYAMASLYTREIPLSPSHLPVQTGNRDPVQCRAMDKDDIAEFRRWHRNAAERAVNAGFDVIYVYSAHNLSVLFHFLSKRWNHRSDEYGGSLVNRVRLLREVLDDTADVIAGRTALAVRISLDELVGAKGLEKNEAEDAIGMLAELPDLWDVTLSDWSNDSQTSRFSPEAVEEPFVHRIKKLTTKPVVGVGRFTSPDTMVSQVRRGILDFIGAARPSIADPFLPKKIEEGRLDEIRECIGCNICVAHDELSVPIRCTQNPTQGEEWRKGWHPERAAPAGSESGVLVVGSGPAGLECANHLTQRGYSVTIAEARGESGGRVAREARLPGLNAWARVQEHRELLLKPRANADIYLESPLDAEAVLEFGFERVVVATGSEWRRDGIARYHQHPVPGLDMLPCLTPDDILDGKRIDGHVLIYDDDHYYLGSLLAEQLANEGRKVTYVTPAGIVSSWSVATLDQHRIQKAVIECCDAVHVNTALIAADAGKAVLECVFTGRETEIVCDAILPVTARLPKDQLFRDLKARKEEWAQAGIKSVDLIGDAYAPGTIAAAVYAGHRFARLLDEETDRDAVPFRREMTWIEDYDYGAR